MRRETHPARVGHVCRAGKSCPRQETYAEAASQGERHPPREGMMGAHIDSGMAVPPGWRRKKVSPYAKVVWGATAEGVHLGRKMFGERKGKVARVERRGRGGVGGKW